MHKQLHISELKPGMLVTQVIEQKGPVRIRRVGMIKSEEMVKGLTEMGVSIVEIDEAQSFTIDSGSEALGVQEPKPASVYSMTPTQRLMASDKHLSKVDRQLSQQFHRSLFMPAIDEMPSKWKLYFKPYAILAGVVVLGFGLGFAARQIPNWLELVNTSQTTAQSTVQQPTDANAVMLKPANENTVDAKLRETANSASPPVNEGDSSSALLRGQPSVDEAPLAADVAADAKTNQGPGDSTQDQIQNTPVPTEINPPEQRQSINGIVLNEGETILGYNAPTQDPANESQGAEALDVDATQTLLSADLMRRVNQAAAQVDRENAVLSPEDGQDDQFLEQMLGEVKKQGLIPVSPARAEATPRSSFSGAQPPSTAARIDQLPASILEQIPAMSFSAHMYASNPQDRWVRVNGRRLSEGDLIAEDLAIVEIAPENIVLAFKGSRFTMNALSDW
jgi:general secretion pathway protein B